MEKTLVTLQPAEIDHTRANWKNRWPRRIDLPYLFVYGTLRRGSDNEFAQLLAERGSSSARRACRAAL